MRPLPNTTIAVESLRDWLLDAANGSPAQHAIDRDLARSLAAGIPSAWALYHDVVKPRLIGAAFTLCGDSKLAADFVDRVSSQLYIDRADERRTGLAGLPPGLPLFQLCRASLLREIALVTKDPAERALADPFGGDAIALAHAIGPTAPAAPPSANATLARILELECDIPTELRALDLPEALERQRRGSRDLARNVRILNLPAVLLLVFFVTLGIAGAYIASTSQAGPDRRELDLLQTYVLAGRFDDALRLLGDDPPPGCEGLAPLRPESRSQHLRELRAKSPERPRLAVAFPHGRIDTQTPRIQIDRDPTLKDAIQLRLVDSSTGDTVISRKLNADESIVDPKVALERGHAYVVSIESPNASTRAQFEILTELESVVVERRIGDLLARFPQSEASFHTFLRAHVYRAEGCFEASLGEWRGLAAAFPDRTYPREEAACLIDSEYRLSWHALAELTRRP